MSRIERRSNGTFRWLSGGGNSAKRYRVSLKTKDPELARFKQIRLDDLIDIPEIAAKLAKMGLNIAVPAPATAAQIQDVVNGIEPDKSALEFPHVNGNGSIPPSSRTKTIQEFTSWILRDWDRTNKYKPGTWKNSIYASVGKLTVFLTAVKGYKYLTEVTLEDLKDFLLDGKSNTGKPWSPPTQGKYCRVIKSYFKQACGAGHVYTNLVSDVSADLEPAKDLRNNEDKQYAQLTNEDIQVLFGAEKLKDFHKLFRWTFATSLRFGDAIRLEYKNIEWFTDVKTGQKTGAKWLTRVRKLCRGGKIERQWKAVPDQPQFGESTSLLEELIADVEDGATGYLFGDVIDGKTDDQIRQIGSKITKTIQRTLRNADLDDTKKGFHSIRVSVQNQARKDGVELDKRRVLLGHSSVEMTGETYGRYDDDEALEAVNQVKFREVTI